MAYKVGHTCLFYLSGMWDNLALLHEGVSPSTAKTQLGVDAVVVLLGTVDDDILVFHLQ